MTSIGVPSVVSVEKSASRVPFFSRFTVTQTRGAVAKSISAVFGDGILTGSDGGQTEKNLFGQPSSWMDYSGSVDTGAGAVSAASR